MNRGQKQMRRDRSKLYQENVDLKEKLEADERKYQTYKKKCHRLNRRKDNDNKETGNQMKSTTI